MKITSIEVVRTTKPISLAQEYRAAWFEPDGKPLTTYGFAFYKVHTDEGIVGLGPCSGVPDSFATSALIGLDPFFIEKFCCAGMSGREMTYNRGSYGGLEVALWDIVGKASGKPVYKILGAYRDKIPAYAATSRLLQAEQHVSQVLELAEMGFKAVKLRLHRPDPREDLAVVQAVRKAAGDDLMIIVDANQNHKSINYHHWSRQTALNMARELQDLDVYFLEEPLPRRDFDGLAELAASVEMPIAGGEHACNVHEFKEHILRDTYDILQPDVILGDIGITGTRKIAVIADCFGKQIVPHVCGLGSFALNFPAMLQAVATIENCPMIEYPFDPPILTVETQQLILREPLIIDKSGQVSLPDKPGIGVEIDEDRLSRYL